jgi:uncharacterized flavoprotein (TIGR03862 family)
MSANSPSSAHKVAIIGGGPAGLMAAEIISAAGVSVDVYDAMPSPGRKFLLAGIGGLNLTHAEPFTQFGARYGARKAHLEGLLEEFGAQALRAWAGGLGIETFVGSSGRVFPVGMKAAPLLRSWLQRLRAAGVRLHVRHRWLGWQSGDAATTLRFATPDGECLVQADAVLLALGGGSWARLGSDGAWVPWLAARGVDIAPLQPANCGFDIAWSDHLRERGAGQPLKSIAIALARDAGNRPDDDVKPGEFRRGECVLTATGIEGSLIYALSAAIRDRIARDGAAMILLDLFPDRTVDQLTLALAQPRGSHSLSKHWQRIGIHGVRALLLREALSADQCRDVALVARTLKALPLRCIAPRPLDEAISSAGGVCFGALDDDLMLRNLPGVFCAGEMLDWEAPTGGYLLTACFASGFRAGHGVLRYLDQTDKNFSDAL